ncbi:substrate-binding domain-containing protein [Corynebacterium sp. H130]|uniref:substrate-binding domain-containing protein n=1 Tax=Corynebacterium sp. H130 TaxID=3133444 RepID=UPI0030AD4A3D
MTNAQPLAIAFIKGTAPSKWFDRFNERTEYPDLITMESDDAFGALLDGRCTAALIRLPESRLSDDFHKVDLYEEQPGICVPKDNELTLLEKISRADIAEEIINYEPGETVDIQAVRDNVQVVAANVGVVIAPRPLLRSISSKQTEHREFTDGVPTQISLVWRKDDDSQMIQDFVGITKGRTVNSSRQAAPAKKKPAKKKSVPKPKQKSVAKKRASRGRR